LFLTADRTANPGRPGALGNVGRVADALPGRPSPLGATPRDGGTNFAVASGIAEGVDVCLVDDAGAETQVTLRDYGEGAWHGFVPGIGPGQAYGYRVHGPWDPGRGLLQPGQAAAELGWFTPAGTPMTQANWEDGNALALGVYLDGSDAPDTGPDGQPLFDDDFLVLVNAWWEPLEFTIPDCRSGLAWQPEIDSFDPAGPGSAGEPPRRAGDHVTAGPRSVLVLRGPREPSDSET
jgi:pullulanase/glycogen debranching enzyme